MPWAIVLGCMMFGSLVEGEDYEVPELDPTTTDALNKAVGRTVNFALTFVEEGGAILPVVAAGKKLVRSPEPVDIQGKPTTLILFVDENDRVCIQKPDGSWDCYESS